jgi:hypothetical protein
MSEGGSLMKGHKPLAVILLVVFLFALPCCSSISEKDVVGKWTNAKSPHIWMEFYADKTSTGGNWSVAPDGTVNIVNPDGTIILAKLKDGKLVIEEFGDYGIYIKEGK